jgi:hypothetical protein
MILDFGNGKGDMLFEFTYEGFIIGGSLAQKKSLSIMRREMSLMGKFESISHEYPCGKKIVADEPKRKLNGDGNRIIHIDIPEFDILYQYITNVPWSTGLPVKRALETIDWLESAQRSTVS